ncbi:MAG: D-2-hydroxyacid dehydrogenase, partial [Eubacteriales bacterium]
MKIVILDAYAVNPGDMSWDFLEKYGSLDVYDFTAETEYAARAAVADVLFVNRARLSRGVLSSCRKLKFIGTLGTGYDMIDLDYCREHGITVSNVPAYSSASVAQLAFTLI